MKPLPVTSLTSEDREILAAACRRGPATRWLVHASELADRRDADLMLLAKLNPHYDILSAGEDGPHYLVRWGATARMRGIGYTSSNITYFA